MPLPEEPVPGHYAVRFTKGGPLVPARIIHDGRLWFLFIGGELVGSDSEPWRIGRMETVAFSRRKLSADEYAQILAASAAAQAGDPLTETGTAVDLRAAPPLYRRKT